MTLLFIREEQQPDLVYLRQVPLISVNIMTIVQVIGLLCCVALRATLGAVVFPFMVCVHSRVTNLERKTRGLVSSNYN